MPAAAHAQKADEDSGGRLVRFLEDTLSGNGRTIQVIGLDGALSSRATIRKLIVSDDDGAWLTLEDAVLDWNRLALVRGRFSVNTLSAGRIVFERPPGPSTAPPKPAAPETKPFALPELPVAIQIGEMSIGEIVIGEAVVGTPARLSLDGSLSLADGALDAGLNLQRLDREGDEIVLNASYSNETRQLALDLIAEEAGGGLIGSALKLPGNPPVRLALDGSGPLEEFAAVLDLQTDGETRFGGDVTLRGLTPEEGADGKAEQVPLQFDADLGGDVRALLPQDFHAFFGADTRIRTTGRRDPDGALTIDTLTLNSDALTLDGALDVSAEGEILLAVLQAAVRSGDGGSVILPVPGGDTTLENVRLNALYDAGQGRDWVVEGSVKGLSTPDVKLSALTLDGRGAAGVNAGDDDLSGTVSAELAGLAFADPGLQAAAGDALNLTGAFRLQDAGDLLLEGMTFTGAGLDATVDATISGLDSGMRIEAAGTVATADISRFSELAGQDLSGALAADVDGHFVPLSGAFSVRLDGDADDLALGIAQVDPLIAGHTDLALDATRDEDGITLRSFSIDGAAITADAEGALRSGGSDLRFDARLDDLGRAVPDLPGPAEIRGNVSETGGVYAGQVTLSAPKGIALDADGSYGPGQTAVTLQGGLDDLGVFVPQLPGPASFDGDVKEVDGALVGRINLAAAQGARLAADGTYVAGGTRVTLDGGLDDLGIFVPQLPGPAVVTGEVNEVDGAYVGTIDLAASRGVAVTADGRYAPDAITATFDGSLEDLGIFVAQLPGPGTVAGEIEGNGTDFAGTVDVTASPGVALTADGTYGPGGTRATFDGGLEDLGIFVPQLAGPAKIAGEVEDVDGAYVGKVSVDASAGARATADGAYEPGATRATVTAMLDDLALFVPDLAGPLRLNGDVAEAEDGAYAGTVDMTGPKGIRLAADGRYIAGGTALTLDGGLDDLAAFVPQLPGPATVTGRVEEGDDGYKGSLRLATADGSQANVDGVYGETRRGVRFDALLSNLGVFVAQLQGTARLAGQAEEVDGSYRGDVKLDGSAGVALTARGRYAPAGSSDATFELALDRVERFVPDFPGRFVAKGTASGDGEAWTVKADASGAAGIETAIAGSYSQASGQADVTARGTARLEAANAFIAPMAVSGPLQFDLRLNGEPALQSLAGTVSLPGARVAIPQVFGRIDPLKGQVTLSNGTATVSLDGRWDDGGSFRVSGPVGLTAPFNAGIEVALNQLILTDDSLYRTNLDGQIRASGPLAGGGQIGGVINVGPTELNIAAPTGGGGAPIPVMSHVGEPGAAYATRRRAGLVVEDSGGKTGGGGPVYGLNVTISAPRQIFVRGRGLDAELGGGLSLTGTTANIVPVGEINLIRGRLDLVGRRLELERGLVLLEGSFDPYFEFEASNTSSAGTATLKFFGSLTTPEVEVTSNPELPPEEALGLLVFGDQFTNLSPLKIAQLASSLAALTGRSGPGGGILGGARNELGVSSLDLTTDEEGRAQVGVGTYLTDNIYSDVAVNTEGRTQLNLNFDVSDTITAKGKVDNEGNSSLGIFFSKDF